MPKCFKCEEDYEEEEGKYVDEESETFVCEDCARESDEEGSRCPKCAAEPPDYEEGGKCQNCGYGTA